MVYSIFVDNNTIKSGHVREKRKENDTIYKRILLISNQNKSNNLKKQNEF